MGRRDGGPGGGAIGDSRFFVHEQDLPDPRDGVSKISTGSTALCLDRIQKTTKSRRTFPSLSNKMPKCKTRVI